MNDQSGQPAASQDGDVPDSSESQPSETTGRELVVIEREDRPEGWFTRFMIRVGLRSGGSLRDDLHEALSGEGEAGDVFSPEERAMLQNILRLRERRVEDVMVPRGDIHAVDLDTPLGTLLKTFEETGHSRMPVYAENMDDPRGMVLIKDLLLHVTKRAGKGARSNGNGQKNLDLAKVDLGAPLAKLGVMRKVLFVPPSMLASDLMARMQATRTQMALVIDEYGGTDGLVSLEDIVEEVVGEIEDEHDEEEDAQITHEGGGIWTIDARMELDKVTEALGETFQPGELAEDVDTLGGLVFALAGHVPVRGEVVAGLPGIEFRILDADLRRVRQIQVVQTSLRDRRRKSIAKSSAE